MMKQKLSVLAVAMSAVMSAVISAVASVSAFAEGHHVAEPWTVGDLRAYLADMPEGNVARGKQLNSEMMCASCHGDAGQALSRNWPSTAGQRAVYTYKTLQDYAVGRFAKHQGAEAMAAVSSLLSQQDMADLASYYASKLLPRVEGRLAVLTPAEHQHADQLVRQGDPKRLITPCASCHGVKGEGGINETPALVGQDPYYFERTMQAYKQGTRESDVHAAMRQFARSLTDGEIKALAKYYATRP